MAESLFDIFGDHLTRQTVKHVARQPLSNVENMGKKVTSSAPIKPNEPMKKLGEPTKKLGEPKKSFLANTGKALQSTPVRKAFTPKTVNVGSMIYSDEGDGKGCGAEAMEFTRPTYKYNNFHRDLFDYLPLPETGLLKQFSPPSTPPPATNRHSMELDCSYQDEFYTDDFSNESIPEDDLGLPALY